MLQSYQAIYDHGHLNWLTDKPSVEEALVIVTLLPAEETPVLKAKRQPSPRIAAFVTPLSLRERFGVRAFKKAQIVTVRSIYTHIRVNWILLGRDALEPAIASAIEDASRVIVSAIPCLE